MAAPLGRDRGAGVGVHGEVAALLASQMAHSGGTLVDVLALEHHHLGILMEHLAKGLSYSWRLSASVSMLLLLGPRG
jgi:hypothetical protein